MGNYLKMADKQRIQALLELGWSYRRIQRETGVRRETVARYDPGRAPKPAKVSASSMSKPAGVSPGESFTDRAESSDSATAKAAAKVRSYVIKGTTAWLTLFVIILT
ncbi:MAG: hypothetical protein A2144_04230 [Chloroflexi bacterium RBG_16_50_9]|nr:MAG: hypothetical protein A2144_04230 [Chloroflexi bacterium RBG_16_50_9]